MFGTEFLLNPENQSLENKRSVGSKRKEKEVGRRRLEYQVWHRWLAFYYYCFSVYLKQGDLSASLQVKNPSVLALRKLYEFRYTDKPIKKQTHFCIVF